MARLVSVKKAEFLKLLLYGAPGSGKTRTSGTAALDERTSPVLWLDMAGNPTSIRKYKKLPDVIEIDALVELDPIFWWLHAGQPKDSQVPQELGLPEDHIPYKTVVIDGITETQRMSFKIVTGSSDIGPAGFPKLAERQHFGKVLAQMINLAYRFYKLDMHVIITSLESSKTNEMTGAVTYGPLLWGQSAGEVGGYALMVARLVNRARLQGGTLRMVEGALKDEGELVSVALLQASGTCDAKDQYLTGLPYMVDPSIPKILDEIHKS